MTDREKAIKGLECCMKDDCDNCPYYDPEVDHDCDYFGKCLQGNMYRDALALLKAQEPRVMKVGDVRNWVNSDRVTREPIVIEICGGVCAWIIDDEVRELPGEANLSSDLYSKTWRCWTSRPTDEQREATPWQTPSINASAQNG